MQLYEELYKLNPQLTKKGKKLNDSKCLKKCVHLYSAT